MEPMTMTQPSAAALPLYTSAGVRALDRVAIDEEGVPGAVLMARAGRALFDVLRREYPGASALQIVCGIGNNGGDGFVVARLARDHGVPVTVHLVGEAWRIAGDAARAMAAAIEAGVPICPFAGELDSGPGSVIVDALLGTGLSGAVREQQQAAIAAINRSGLPVVAADIPSGLCSDRGTVLGAAVRASHTVTFIGRKQGLYTGAARDHCGVIHFSDLGVPQTIHARVAPGAELLSLAALLQQWPLRARCAHKGRFGHVLVIGGGLGMAGAAALAGEAAARCGAGLVSVATRREHIAAIVARRPELMVHGVDFAHELEPLLARATVLVIGPGLGRGPWAQQLLQRALASGKPALLDADALNAMADDGIPCAAGPANWLITPHPGEAARLLGWPVPEVEADRFAALAALLEKFPGGVVLKGAGSLCRGSDARLPVGVCPYGNPGMASGGMGDVLSGVIGALLAQGLDADAALRLGICLHGRAADLAASEQGERGLLASDLLRWLPSLLNGRGDDHVRC
jgi:ADP-dependent NAD(P)H-hydrate dehydratase / NAD(P)H-hydrate epimerase